MLPRALLPVSERSHMLCRVSCCKGWDELHKATSGLADTLEDLNVINWSIEFTSPLKLDQHSPWAGQAPSAASQILEFHVLIACLGITSYKSGKVECLLMGHYATAATWPPLACSGGSRRSP